MTAAQIVGALLIALVFAALFAMTAQMVGWREALILWAMSFGLAAVIYLGVALLLGEITVTA